MTKDQVIEEFRRAGAFLDGHFLLSSGLHSANFLQSARVMMDACRGERLCRALVRLIHERLGTDAIDAVVSPAMGGVVVGYEMGRQLGVPAMFAERVDQILSLGRGFGLAKGDRVLMAEDIVTTGKSSRECIDCITESGAHVVAASCLIDRSDGAVDLGVPLFALAGLKLTTYEADQLPAALAAVPAVKPGSRPRP